MHLLRSQGGRERKGDFFHAKERGCSFTAVVDTGIACGYLYAVVFDCRHLQPLEQFAALREIF